MKTIDHIFGLRAKIIFLISILGGILLFGGVVVALVGRTANTTFELFGQQFSSTSVGVALAFIGAVIIAVTFRRVLKSLDRSETIAASTSQPDPISQRVIDQKGGAAIAASHIGTVNIVQPFGNKPDVPIPAAPPSPPLSDAARQILLAVRQDPSGVLQFNRRISSTMLEARTSGKPLAKLTGPREVARWKDAVDELLRLGLIEPHDGRRKDMFDLTHKGYALADQLESEEESHK